MKHYIISGRCIIRGCYRWALKSKREFKRFTESQKAFLKEKFDVGESSGHKLDPEDVASEMRRARNAEGNRIFRIDEFLSGNQVSSYFCRLALKRRKDSRCDQMAGEEDLEAHPKHIPFRTSLSLLCRWCGCIWGGWLGVYRLGWCVCCWGGWSGVQRLDLSWAGALATVAWSPVFVIINCAICVMAAFTVA